MQERGFGKLLVMDYLLTEAEGRGTSTFTKGKVTFKNGSKWNLKGTVRDGKTLRLYGEVGKTFFRTIANIDANGNRAAGTWHSFQGDKRRTGTFIATR